MQTPAASEPQAELSPKTTDILKGVAEAELRRDVEAVVRSATRALAALGRLHLPQDEFEEGDERESAINDKHIELAPYVLAALAAVNQLTDLVVTTFVPPARDSVEPSADDFDLEFDLVDGPTGEGSRLTPERNASTAGLSPRQQVAEVAYALAGMLRSRVASRAPLLRHALGQSGVWPLLAELDDYQHGLTKGVQGLLFGVLGVFQQAARREEIWPEYRSAVREAVDLRAAVADLSYHVGRFNTAMSGAQPAELVPLVVGIADRLARFSARPEYRTLRAEDKKAVIDFRRSLYELRHTKRGVPVLPLRRAVEGFSKFLEAMHSINDREVLVLHDRQRLSEALDGLTELESVATHDPAEARERLLAIIRLLSSLTGRHAGLDQALRASGGAPGAALDIRLESARWRALVEAALATVR
jgi:hypothetical protein